MGIRQTRFQIKNNTVPNAPFSGATLLVGEPIVNTADGILMFSGKTSSTTQWTPAGTGTNSNFFEVGSNLYQLKVRDKITSYGGVTNLTGKFLSGTTNGFVAADITTIQGIDSYVTGYTYSNNTFTIKQNQGQSDLTAVINTMTGLTVNGTLSATTYVGNGAAISGLPYVTGGTPNNTTRVYTFTNSTGGTFNVNSLIDVVVTGGTVNYVGSDGTATFTNSTGGTFNVAGFKDVSTTGATYNAGTATFTKNDGTTYSLSGISSTDTFVTGLTYNSASNLITLSQNQGQTDKTINITSMSGLTLSNLTAGRVPYVGTGGLLTDEAGFTYDSGTNTFSVPSDGSVSVGTGGLSVAGDSVIQGSLTVFGPSISAFTSQLYVEDDNITLNYNPTGNTTTTSIGAGWTIQDGSGIANTATTLNIGVSYNNGNLSPNIEYTSSVGNSNRNLFTQVGDIIIRNTNYDKNSPDGNRVLAEGDILDGGTY